MLYKSCSASLCFLLLLLLALALACNRGASIQPKRYALKGKVVSIDRNAGMADVDAEAIPGFMGAMIMPYTIKPASMLGQLQPGDLITADVVVEPDKYWLENVKVTGHAPLAAGEKPSASLHVPAPGDEVADFKLVNQSGKRISLHQYRGETLLFRAVLQGRRRIDHAFAEHGRDSPQWKNFQVVSRRGLAGRRFIAGCGGSKGGRLERCVTEQAFSAR